jgi:hypothetical protein
MYFAYYFSLIDNDNHVDEVDSSSRVLVMKIDGSL